MPSITCTHCGATLKTANPVATGKKVTCPKCKKAFVVEDEEEPEEQEADDDEAPAAKKSAKKKGDAEPAKSNIMLFALVGGGIFVLFLCCAGGGITAFFFRDKLGFGSTTVADAKDKEKEKEKPNKDGPGPVVEAKPDFTMTAQEFADDFFKDPKANANKYFNKTCDITGEVAKIEWAFNGSELILKGFKKAGDFNLRLKLNPEQEPLAHRFSRGQKIKMVAKMSGHGDLGNHGHVDFRDGVLTAIDKSTLIETSAEAFAAEFEKNANQAQAKYNGKEVIVSGIVESVKDQPGGNADVRLKGTAKTAIVALLIGNDKKKAVVGQPLDLRGDFGFGPPFLGGGQIQLAMPLVAAKKK